MARCVNHLTVLLYMWLCANHVAMYYYTYIWLCVNHVAMYYYTYGYVLIMWLCIIIHVAMC